MSYPKLNGKPEKLRIGIKHNEVKKLISKTEKQSYQNLLESPKIDKEYFRKTYKSSDKKEILLTVSEILFGSSSTLVSSTSTIVNPGVGIPIANSWAPMTSKATLITNDFFQN